MSIAFAHPEVHSAIGCSSSHSRLQKALMSVVYAPLLYRQDGGGGAGGVRGKKERKNFYFRC